MKVLVFKNAKTELFAEYLREDGLVRRVTRLGAGGPADVQSVRETFVHRKDKLMTRASLPAQVLTM